MRLAEVTREEHMLGTEAVQRDQLQTVAARVEDFREAISAGLEHADIDQRRALVELLVDRVVTMMPTTGELYVKAMQSTRGYVKWHQDRPVAGVDALV